MGSSSDWETMRHAAETLDAARRRRTRRRSSRRTARPSGSTTMPIRPRSAGSRWSSPAPAARRTCPGMTASMTALPVLGVPIESQALKGMDSLLSIVQMPAGVPVGTLAIGKAGAINAGAARRGDARDAATRRSPRGSRRGARSRRDRWPKRPNEHRAGLARSASSAAASSAGCSPWRRRSSATNATSSTRHEHAPAAEVAAHFTRARLRRPRRAARASRDSVDVATYEFENLPVAPLEVLGDKLRPSTRSLAIAQDRAREKAFIEGCGARVAAVARGLEPRRRHCRRSLEARPAAGAEDPPLRL